MFVSIAALNLLNPDPKIFFFFLTNTRNLLFFFFIILVWGRIYLADQTSFCHSKKTRSNHTSDLFFYRSVSGKHKDLNRSKSATLRRLFWRIRPWNKTGFKILKVQTFDRQGHVLSHQKVASELRGICRPWFKRVKSRVLLQKNFSFHKVTKSYF